MNEEDVKKIVIKTVQEYNKSTAFIDRKTTDTPTDSFSVVNKRYVSRLTSVVAISSGSNTLSSISGALQAVVHNLGVVPSRFSFDSTMDGSVSQSKFDWNLNANGNKGTGLFKFDDNASSQGTYPYNLTGGSPLIHVGQDTSNRMVATIKSSDTSVMTMEWAAVGAPTGTVRFVAQFQ